MDRLEATNNFSAVSANLAPRVKDISVMISRDGFAFIPELASGAMTQSVVDQLGYVLKLGNGDPVHQIRPKREAAPNTYSGVYGLNAFPMHTDMAHWKVPPRYLVLRCVRGHHDVSTYLVHGATLVELVGKASLARALVLPRRPLRGKLPLLALYTRRPHAGYFLRWDDKFIVPASPAGRQGVDRVRQALEVVTPTCVTLAHPGDTLIIDNWKMLHGRSMVMENCADRIIDRVYLGELH